MSRVAFRVHGPFLHRSRWRLDVFDNGKRSKLSFATYREALLEAHSLLTAGNFSNPDVTSGSTVSRK